MSDLRGSDKWNGDCVAKRWDSDLRDNYQCKRKAKQMVGRLPLCTQHAKQAEKSLGLPFNVCKEMLAWDDPA